MPTYEMWCPACEEGLTVFCSIAARNEQVHTCGATLQKLISKLTVVGPTHSRPLDYQKQLGETFATTAERDAYFEKHHCIEKSASDSSIRKMKDRLSESRTKNAQKLGFNSIEHQQQHWKKERDRRRDLGS